MAYVSLVAECLGCRVLFASNPLFVPSLNNQPICRSCVERVNIEKRKAGMPEFTIHPDAYEPLPEEHL